MPEPNVDLDEAEAFIRHVLNKQRARDYDPKRCARKLWTIGTFTLVTFLQALAILIAQNAERSNYIYIYIHIVTA